MKNKQFFITILFYLFFQFPSCSCGEKNGNSIEPDGNLDTEEEICSYCYEGPIAEPWEGKVPINVFGANRDFGGFPFLTPDRNGGLIITAGCDICYDPFQGMHVGGVLQRIDSLGKKLWGENGILVPVGRIGNIFLLNDLNAYIWGGYENDIHNDMFIHDDEMVYYFTIMNPDGIVDMENAYYFTEDEIHFDTSEVNYLITHDDLLLVSIRQPDTEEKEGYWCFLGLDRNLNSWTGGIKCLFPLSQCEGLDCFWGVCGNVHVKFLGMVENPEGNFVFLFQKFVDEPQSDLDPAIMEPGEIYIQIYDRNLNQLNEPGCYGSLVGSYDYLCESNLLISTHAHEYVTRNEIFCPDIVEKNQLTPELTEILGNEIYERVEYVMKFGPENNYAPSWTPYNSDYIFPYGLLTTSTSTQNILSGGWHFLTEILPDNIGGIYAFTAYWNEEMCNITCPPIEYYIQHFDKHAKTTYGNMGKKFMVLSRTPDENSHFSLRKFATTDEQGNLFYAWLHPINPVDTDWPVDEPIPWGWAYRVCVQKATPQEVNVWQGNPHPCVEVFRYPDIVYKNGEPIGGIVPDGEGGVIIVFIGAEDKWYAQRVSADGELMWDARE